MVSNNQQAFLELVRAGLWEKEARLSQFGDIDYAEVLRLAEEQAVVGLVAAGFEHVVDVKVPQMWALQFAGQTIQLEQRNKAMNSFIATAVEKMGVVGICGVLVKGSGLAKCYERPLWRSCGDIDFFFSIDNYKKAKEFFLKWPNAAQFQDAQYTKSFGVAIDPWIIELHGTLRNGLTSRMDHVIDEVQNDIFFGGKVRSCKFENTIVYLPSSDNDVFLVFIHFVKHLYKEGMNLRQVCDWCRLLWTYRDSLNHGLLESLIGKAGLTSEWKAFAALAVDYLGINSDVMPLYDASKRWGKKSEQIKEIILKGGGWRKVRDTISVGRIFPMSVIKFAPGILLNVNWLKIKERVF